MLLVARAQLVSQRQAVANNIRGLLKTFGHVISRGSKGLFSARVREAVADNPALSAITEPLLIAWQANPASFVAALSGDRVRDIGVSPSPMPCCG